MLPATPVRLGLSAILPKRSSPSSRSPQAQTGPHFPVVAAVPAAVLDRKELSRIARSCERFTPQPASEFDASAPRFAEIHRLSLVLPLMSQFTEHFPGPR